MKIKSFFAVILFSLFAVSAFAQSNSTATIEWQKDYSLALKTAQAAGKPLLINFVAEWCLPCKTMEKAIWSKPAIVGQTKDFIAVAVDFDRDRQTVKHFGVTSLPNVILADPWGNMLAFHHGFGKETSEADVAAVMKNVHKDFSEIRAAYLRTETDKRDAAALIEIGEFYRKINALFLSNKYFKLALNTKQLKSNANLREQVMAATGENYLKLRDYDEAERFFNDSLREFPDGKHSETAFFGLLTINLRRQRFAEAETLVDKMKSKYPDSEFTRQAAEDLQQAKTQLN